MTIPFCKYHGTGNDFILLDQREVDHIELDQHELIRFICDRRFGIGGDGLIILKNHRDYHFEMIYYNSDGHQSSMCGNGGRCIVAFAKKIGIIEDEYSFIAIDGPHKAKISADEIVSLEMINVPEIKKGEEHFELNTGSPHYVTFVEDVDDINVIENGQAIRYSKPFREEGINVNFVEKRKDKIVVLTYERGVEGETFSCGTGVTAAAIASRAEGDSEKNNVDIQTRGEMLNVRFEKSNKGFQNIWLSGHATLVFEGDFQTASQSFFPDLATRITS